MWIERREETNMNSTDSLAKTPEIQGHFLYPDYTPLEDNRNVVEMLNTFVSLTSRLIKLRVANENLSSMLDDSDSLRNDILSAIKQIQTSASSTIEHFESQHSETLASELHAECSTMLDDTKDALLALLSDTETGFAERHQKYKDKIIAKIKENEREAITLVHNWLSNEYANLPRSILANLSSDILIALDPGKSVEGYSIRRVVSAGLSKSEEKKHEMERDMVRFSYAMAIESNELEFWNRRRKAAELGIKEAMLPIGMKAPISEKLKQTFKFGLGDSEPAKEADFRKADDYYVISAELQGEKTLTLQLASDIARPSSSLFKITYNVSSLSAMQGQLRGSGASFSAHDRPRLDYYKIDENGQASENTDLLQIAEIEKSTDVSRLILLGAAMLSKINILGDPMTLLSRGELESLEAGETKVVIKANRSQRIDFVNLFEFLRLVASMFYSILKKLKEKTPVKGEVIIRQELTGGHRKEFTLGLDDMRSHLADERYGKPILDALGA
jgi:hypothetical protein